MKKRIFAGFGVAAALYVVGWAMTPLYVWAIMRLDWRAYFVFPPLAGIIAWVMIYFFGDAGKTIDQLIEEKIRSRRRKKIFLYLYERGKFFAFVFAAFVLGPCITPLIMRVCISNKQQAYLYSALLNIATSAIGIFFYFGGWGIIKAIFDIK